MDEPLMYTPHDMMRPIVALVAWTLAMQVWMLATRLPALSAAGVRLRDLKGTKAADADRSLPAGAQWKAHNYNHLLEQPTLFYAVVLVIALAGGGDGPAIALAWSYVALRIAHSLWQATINRVLVRLWLYLASSAALAALTFLAAKAVW